MSKIDSASLFAVAFCAFVDVCDVCGRTVGDLVGLSAGRQIPVSAAEQAVKIR